MKMKKKTDYPNEVWTNRKLLLCVSYDKLLIFLFQPHYFLGFANMLKHDG